MGMRGDTALYFACDGGASCDAVTPTGLDPIGLISGASKAGWLVGTFTGQAFCPAHRELNENLSSVEFARAELKEDR